MSQGGPCGQSLSRLCSMKQLRVLLLPPGWDANSITGLPPAVCRRYLFIHQGEETQRGASFSSKETTRELGLGLEPLTFRSKVQHANCYTTAPLHRSPWLLILLWTLFSLSHYHEILNITSFLPPQFQKMQKPLLLEMHLLMFY